MKNRTARATKRATGFTYARAGAIALGFAQPQLPRVMHIEVQGVLPPCFADICAAHGATTRSVPVIHRTRKELEVDTPLGVFGFAIQS